MESTVNRTIDENGNFLANTYLRILKSDEIKAKFVPLINICPLALAIVLSIGRSSCQSQFLLMGLLDVYVDLCYFELNHGIEL